MTLREYSPEALKLLRHYDAIDANRKKPKSGYYANGFHAYQCGRLIGTNPHTPGTIAHQDWVKGFERAFIQDTSCIYGVKVKRGNNV